LSLTVSAGHFASGRHFAAWLGLTPKEHSTGGKPRLGKISKAGNERLRSLLVVGATAVIRHVRPDRPGAWAWLVKLLERKPRKLAAVALANKMARIVSTACTQVWNGRLLSPLSYFFLWPRREPVGGEEAAMLTSLGHFGDERLAKGGPFCCNGCARWACTAFACVGWAARARVRCGLGGC
jgi:transposase IS116/IS110/IS902 family protein